MTRPFVRLTTDFGLADPSVGICKGVILSIVPDARIVDVSHAIARQAVPAGAVLLASALPYLPVGVHMAVVDPGVGTERRPVALRCARGDVLVGPDNGLLVPAAESLGGATSCHALTDERFRLAPLSATFHGRDVFAPAAAYLAAGTDLSEFGPAVAPADLVRPNLPSARVQDGAMTAVVVAIDAFGSAQLLAGRDDLEHAVGTLRRGDLLQVRVEPGAGRVADAAWGETYGDVAAGEPVVLADSYGRVAIAINMGNAAERLGIETGMWLRVARA